MLRKLLIALAMSFMLVSAAFSAFDEDSYLFEAVELEAQNQFEKARDMYLVLYEETNKLEYLKEAIMLSSMLNNPSATLDFTNEYLAQGGKSDLVIHKVLLDSYLKLGLSDRALVEAKIIAKEEDSVVLDDIIGSLYAANGEFDEALKHLEKAYAITKNQDILQKIVAIYLSQYKHKDALEKLDKHIQAYGCSEGFCKFSIDIYAKFNDVSKLENLFEKAYELNPSIENAKNLILLYANLQKFKEATEIAARYPFTAEILLELYIAQKDYKNAALAAKNLYKEKDNPYFLALAQVYSFESLSNKQDIKPIKDITNELSRALKLMETPDKSATKDKRADAALQSFQNAQSSDMGFFLNFLGYLMIDYDIDVKGGITHIKRALEFAPKNSAYLDSLAWGYYKLKDCQNAKHTFSQIPESEVKKEQELKDHKALIEKCKI